MAQLLWRVEGTAMAPNREGWQQGLTLHLLFQPLTLIVARRNGRTRHYVALGGCPQCRPDGCDRVCHRVLFEQLVRTTLPGVTLVPTPRLLPRPTETRRLLATPHSADARPLDAAFLEQWDEGRLIVTWSRLQAKPQPIRVGALLAVGQQGPEPGAALRALGWRDSGLVALLRRSAFEQPLPGPAPVSHRAGEALFHSLYEPRSLTGGWASASPNVSELGEPYSDEEEQADDGGLVAPATLEA